MKALKETEDGILIDIEVSPNSAKFVISGYNEWRDEINVRITSAPQKGKANKEIIKEFSKLTKAPVEIVSGLKSHHKTLKVYGVSKMKFLEILIQESPDLKKYSKE
jgi:uncharacterized protein (TIGR00251 family)